MNLLYAQVFWMPYYYFLCGTLFCRTPLNFLQKCSIVERVPLDVNTQKAIQEEEQNKEANSKSNFRNLATVVASEFLNAHVKVFLINEPRIIYSFFRIILRCIYYNAAKKAATCTPITIIHPPSKVQQHSTYKWRGKDYNEDMLDFPRGHIPHLLKSEKMTTGAELGILVSFCIAVLHHLLPNTCIIHCMELICGPAGWRFRKTHTGYLD